MVCERVYDGQIQDGGFQNTLDKLALPESYRPTKTKQQRKKKSKKCKNLTQIPIQDNNCKNSRQPTLNKTEPVKYIAPDKACVAL